MCRRHCTCRWCALPLVAAALGVVTVATAYVWARAQDRYAAFLPLISTSGSRTPEAGAFTLGLVVFAWLTGIGVALQHRRVAGAAAAADARHGSCCRVTRTNTAALALGWLSMAFLLVTASFPARDVTLNPHLAAAALTFALGLAYATLDVLVLHWTQLAPARTHWPRVAFIVVGTLCMAAMAVLLIGFRSRDLLGGVSAYAWAALAEYVFVLGFFAFIASHAADFAALDVAITVQTRAADAVAAHAAVVAAHDATAGGGHGDGCESVPPPPPPSQRRRRRRARAARHVAVDGETVVDDAHV